MNIKLCMNYVFILSILSVLISCISVDAVTITDDTGDVWYSSESNGWLWSSQNNTDHPYIDIISVDYAFNESFLTFEMTLKDEIDETKNVGFEIYYGNFTGRPYYMARYLAYSGSGKYSYISDKGVEYKGSISNPISEDGKVFSFTFEIENIDSSFEIWGKAYEDSYDYTESWVDFFPLKFEPELDYNGTNGDEGGDSDDNDIDDEEDEDDTSDETSDDDINENTSNNHSQETPGFEIIILLCAITFIIFKKQNRNN